MIVAHVGKPDRMKPCTRGTNDIGLGVISHIEDLLLCHPKLLDEPAEDERVRFAKAQVPGYEHRIKERGEA